MGVEPRWTCTVEAVTVPGSIGSLKTMTTVELSGTSRLPDDGYVRTTVGECLSGTVWMKCRGFSPPLSVTVISSVSPALAGIATGSKPPAPTGTERVSPVLLFRIWATRPPGAVPGVSET